MYNYSILVNTTDSFEDCWVPFFTLFTKFWPDFKGKIYLNTELKTYVHQGIDIISIKNCESTGNTKITWSQCLLRALNFIDSDIILYMQDDYFIKDFVKSGIVERFANLIKNNNDIDCIHLTDQSVLSSNQSTKYEDLYEVVLNQRYRISCQAALWRKDVLLSYLRPYENAWQFEEFGSRRAAILKHNFYVVDQNWIRLNANEIIPYLFTGIVQGKWIKDVLPLFNQNNITFDSSRRGFVSDMKPKPMKLKFIYQWKRIPFLYKHYLDLYRLKINKNKKPNR